MGGGNAAERTGCVAECGELALQAGGPLCGKWNVWMLFYSKAGIFRCQKRAKDVHGALIGRFQYALLCRQRHFQDRCTVGSLWCQRTVSSPEWQHPKIHQRDTVRNAILLITCLRTEIFLENVFEAYIHSLRLVHENNKLDGGNHEEVGFVPGVVIL